ncbi:hypothetical protein HDV63DRAFT_61804 [Trichoderma sp. SZMC 28014]
MGLSLRVDAEWIAIIPSSFACNTSGGEATRKKEDREKLSERGDIASGVARRGLLHQAVGRRRCNVRIRVGHGAISDVSIVHCWLWRIKRFHFFLFACVCVRARSLAIPPEHHVRLVKTCLYESLLSKQALLTFRTDRLVRTVSSTVRKLLVDSFELYGGWNFKLQASALSILTCKEKARHSNNAAKKKPRAACACKTGIC